MTYLFRFSVECTRRFVKQYDARIPQNRPGDGNPLFLTAAELSASGATVSLEPLRERLDEGQDIRIAGCPLDRFQRDVRSRAQCDVVSDRALEQSGFLRDKGHVASIGRELYLRQCKVSQGYVAGRGIVVSF